jgi:hypothetical protein
MGPNNCEPDVAEEFSTSVYSYQTHSESDPRNALVLATPQGISIQEDVPGRGRVLFHEVAVDGIRRYFLEAERSTKGVGGSQKETEKERNEAIRRGKATAVRIGTPAMGTRFNVQLLIQIPLEQAGSAGGYGFSENYSGEASLWGDSNYLGAGNAGGYDTGGNYAGGNYSSGKKSGGVTKKEKKSSVFYWIGGALLLLDFLMFWRLMTSVRPSLGLKAAAAQIPSLKASCYERNVRFVLLTGLTACLCHFVFSLTFDGERFS